MGWRLGIDAGGSFTDLLVLDDRTGEIRLLKTASSPKDPVASTAEGLRRLLQEAGVTADSIERVRYSCELPRRVLRERSGARLGLLVTEGFETVLHLARGRTPAPLGGWAGMAPPRPLADLALTRGVPERIGPRGDVVRPLDEAAAAGAARELLAAGIDALIIAFVHAYANPAHERRVGGIVAAMAPDLPVILASETLPEDHEYERTLLAVLNGYLRPGLAHHLTRLGEALREQQVRPPPAVMCADGGWLSPARAALAPARTLRAGPAGGAVAASLAASLAGCKDTLGLDMGGGAAELSLIREGRPAIAREARIDGLAVHGPTVDIHTLEIGGATLVHLGPDGALRIGPRAAAAGPACFGHGEEPTLTDANVVLGRLPDRLGDTALSAAAAEDAIGTLAERLDLDLHEAALAIVTLAEETLAGALRLMAARHGARTEALALVAFGGAGPLHGNALAALIGSYPVIVPPLPGVMSALGFVCAAPREEAGITLVRRLDALAAGEIAGHLERLVEMVRTRLREADVALAEQTIACEAELRYAPDGTGIAVPVEPGGLGDDASEDLARRFAARHERRFGFHLEEPIELVALRALGRGRLPGLPPTGIERGGPEPTAATSGQQRLCIDGDFVTATRFDRARLRSGNRIQGPALVVQADASTLILPGHTGEVDGQGCLLITRGSAT